MGVNVVKQKRNQMCAGQSLNSKSYYFGGSCYLCTVSHFKSWKYEMNAQKLLKFDGQFKDYILGGFCLYLEISSTMILVWKTTLFLNKRSSFHLANRGFHKKKEEQSLFTAPCSYLFFSVCRPGNGLYWLSSSRLLKRASGRTSETMRVCPKVV